MYKQRHWFVLTTAALAATTLWAAEPAAPPAQAGSAKPAATAKPDGEASTAAARPDAAKPEPNKSDPNKPEAPKTADAAKPEKGKAADSDKGSPQRFIPSEQVRADFDVSFPIDI